MGRDFKNEFSWSTSRERLFSDCARAYWWRYYAHWGGWGRDATPEQRVAYRLGKMDSLATWGGTIVHDLIEQAIKALRDRGTPIDRVRLREQARARLRGGWVESRDGHWIRDPKRKLLLWEHYYGGEADRSRERADQIAARIYGSLEHFCDGDFPALLARLKRPAFRNIEVLASIQIDGQTVYVKPDLAFDHPDDGSVWLVDWKTGRPRDGEGFQLATYALFAQQTWKIPPERVRGVLVYLATGEHKPVPINPESLDEASARIRASITTMRAKLRDPENNAGSIEDFPKTEASERCHHCNFRQLCFGTAGIAGAAQAGDPVG